MAFRFNFLLCGVVDMGKVKETAAVFELPSRLGILQYVEYEPEEGRRASEGPPYEGLLTAEGCRRGVCIKYRVRVWSRDRRLWEAEERWRRRRDEEVGGCIRQKTADALWELSGKYDVGLWYEYRRVGMGVNLYNVLCGVVVNGIKLGQPYCSTVEECVERILEYYRREVERLKEPPQPALVIEFNPVEELLREWPELGAFGADWLKAWAPHAKERLIEIAKAMRRYPWMVDVIKQRPVGNPHPYMVEVYVARDGSEVCLSLTPPKAFCAQNGAVKEVKLELEFSQHEVYEERIRKAYRPKGLLAFTTAAKEYIKVL